MAKFQIPNVRDLGIAVILSYFVVTLLNIVVSTAFPKIPILKTGSALILLMVAVIIVMAFIFAADKKVTREELIMFFAILFTMVAVYYVVKTSVPGLFNILPDSLKEIFSAVGV